MALLEISNENQYELFNGRTPESRKPRLALVEAKLFELKVSPRPHLGRFLVRAAQGSEVIPFVWDRLMQHPEEPIRTTWDFTGRDSVDLIAYVDALRFPIEGFPTVSNIAAERAEIVGRFVAQDDIILEQANFAAGPVQMRFYIQ